MEEKDIHCGGVAVKTKDIICQETYNSDTLRDARKLIYYKLLVVLIPRHLLDPREIGRQVPILHISQTVLADF